MREVFCFIACNPSYYVFAKLYNRIFFSNISLVIKESQQLCPHPMTSSLPMLGPFSGLCKHHEIIQSLCKEMPHRIKDYIAKPKPNGYSSLHVAINVSDDGRTRLLLEIHMGAMLINICLLCLGSFLLSLQAW